MTHAIDTGERRPSAKQLAYLRALAIRAGQSFTYPATARRASSEIQRLKAATPSSRAERVVERKQIADAIATGPADSARVRDAEIAGWGSNCRWSH